MYSSMMSFLSDWDYVCRIDLDRRSLPDEMDRDDQPMAFVLAHQDPPETFQWPSPYLHHHTFMKVWVDVVPQGAGHQCSQGFDLLIRNRLGTSPADDDLDHTGNLQHRGSLLPGKPGKTVAGKKRGLDLLFPVLPLAQPYDGREQVFDTLSGQPIAHLLFMSGPCPDGIPSRGSIFFRHSSALSLTERTISSTYFPRRRPPWQYQRTPLTVM